MSILLRYWYVLLLAFVLSLVAAVAILMMSKDQWSPAGGGIVEDKFEAATELVEMSERYLKWNYDTMIIDELRVQYSEESESLEKERRLLEALRQQVDADVQELLELRAEIDQLRESVTKEFVAIADSELDNLKRLAKVYEEMKPVPVVMLFKEMEMELVVKLMSQISPEAASKILAEMSNPAQGPETLGTAVAITEELRKLKK